MCLLPTGEGGKAAKDVPLLATPKVRETWRKGSSQAEDRGLKRARSMHRPARRLRRALGAGPGNRQEASCPSHVSLMGRAGVLTA